MRSKHVREVFASCSISAISAVLMFRVVAALLVLMFFSSKKSEIRSDDDNSAAVA